MNEEECGICYEAMWMPMITSCGHYLCQMCWEKSNKEKCCECGTKLTNCMLNKHLQRSLLERKLIEANKGDWFAQYKVALYYETNQDEKSSVKWYRKAAEQGHSSAQFNLGVCYQQGYGVEVDSKEAVKWYRKAAEQGHRDGQYKLSMCDG